MKVGAVAMNNKQTTIKESAAEITKSLLPDARKTLKVRLGIYN